MPRGNPPRSPPTNCLAAVRARSRRPNRSGAADAARVRTSPEAPRTSRRTFDGDRGGNREPAAPEPTGSDSRTETQSEDSSPTLAPWCRGGGDKGKDGGGAAETRRRGCSEALPPPPP